MTHIDDDALLGHALDTIDDDAAKNQIVDHLAHCPECRRRLDEIWNDIDIIGSINPNSVHIGTPFVKAKPRIAVTLIRAAAFITIGFLGGLTSAKWISSSPATVTPLYADLTPIPDSLSGTAAPDATQISR
jgi:hypothetical protein